MISLLQEAATTAAEHTESVASSIAQGETEAATGLPQLDLTTFANQIFWLIITMLVLYWVVARIALPRIGAVLSDRQGAMTGDLMAAEEFKLKAKEAETAYDKALADARAEAGKIVAANRAEIQKELDAAIAHADAEISARGAESEKRIREIRDSADTDAREVARDVAAELVRAFGGTVDQTAVDQAVDSRMKGVLQ